MREVITIIEADEHVKVVVFDSAVEGFFLNHSDFLADFEDLKTIPQGPTGLEAWPDILVRITRAPVVSIALIRGRATGNGSEIALACDMTFVSADDIGGELAQAYGYVNRALPDAELDGFVDALATRIAGFDKWSIANTKRLVNASLPPDVEIAAGWDTCMSSVTRPVTQARLKTFFQMGFHKPGEAEDRLGAYLGRLGQ